MLSLAKSNTTAAGRKYVVRTMAFMGGYTAVNVAAIFGAFDEIIGKPVSWALALAVAAPVAGQIWATLSLMRESDEYVRAVVGQTVHHRRRTGHGLGDRLGLRRELCRRLPCAGLDDLSAVLGLFRPDRAVRAGVEPMKNRLKLLRVERGWTQEQLGQALGVSRQAVNALETEKHDPSLDLAYRIAVLFARPVEEIFENPHA